MFVYTVALERSMYYRRSNSYVKSLLNVIYIALINAQQSFI